MIHKFENKLGVAFYLFEKGNFGVAELVYASKPGRHPDEVLQRLHDFGNIMELNRIYVQPSSRCLGYGKKLMETLIDYCNRNNCSFYTTKYNYGSMTDEKLAEFLESYGVDTTSCKDHFVYAGTNMNAKIYDSRKLSKNARKMLVYLSEQGTTKFMTLFTALHIWTNTPKGLIDRGLITAEKINNNQFYTLTQKGREVAETIKEQEAENV